MLKGTSPVCCRKHWEEHSQKFASSLDLGNNQFALMNALNMPFMVCKTCGCKRCPKATDCSLDCTDSNEPGQVGSVYA